MSASEETAREPQALASAVVLDAPPAEFRDVGEVLERARFDVRYHGTDNFVGARIDGYEAPRCFLTRPACEALSDVARALEREGLSLLIYDCYRPARAVAHFARWAADAADLRTRAEYYPDLRKADLFALGYIAARSGHSRGSTLDLTLADLKTGAPLDMGTPFDLFSERSWPDSPDVTAEQKGNRDFLADVMGRHDFDPFHMEWWHFTLRGEPFPDTYFDFPIR
ncbi:M15 family metallopeptidase [Aquabacter sp. L1I39]|uniref:M15 family metallopeptidase n=1 Tax=Aquabacter sp. L1I39 TaxID=2820278 RepID=UPI001ADAFD38|nr:M15 family metallopeptidase [Aquabacter sp. L1I39]QTL05472.1 M15 family metallopeptidase [Aquabacter sp. L1I39]